MSEKLLAMMVYYDLEKAIKPPQEEGYYRIIRDSWWCVDPVKGLVFYRDFNHPQCNSERSITERFIKTFELRYISYVCIPYDPWSE